MLEHDVDSFADDIIAREILSKSSCFVYPKLVRATHKSITEAAAETAEFAFCRKILQMKVIKENNCCRHT